MAVAATAYRAPFSLSCAVPIKYRSSLLFSVDSSGFYGGALPSVSAARRWRRRRHRFDGNQVASSSSNGPERVTSCQWNEYVLASDVPVLVEFWASWCGPCTMVRKIMEEISEEYAERVKFFRIEADDYPQIAKSYEIDRIPTVLLFKDGEKAKSMSGTLPKSVYVKAIDKLLS